MSKIRSFIILNISLILVCMSLTGCSSIKDEVIPIDKQPFNSTESNVTIVPEISQSITDIIQTEPSDTPTKEGLNIIDYNQYLKKIWVVNNWDSYEYDYFSFYISSIENGVIEGKLSTYDLSMPDFCFFRLEPSIYLGDLFGTVNDGIAECYFSDKVGNKGNVTLVFKETNEIEVTIEYTEKETAYQHLSLDGIYLFKPYNLADIKGFTLLEEHSFTDIEINSWGSVNLTSGEIVDDNKIYPVIFLTNEQDDILYQFAPFHTGSKIKEVSIKDMNNDGLMDIFVITGFEDTEIELLDWNFIQMDDGLFYEGHLDDEIDILYE